MIFRNTHCLSIQTSFKGMTEKLLVPESLYLAFRKSKTVRLHLIQIKFSNAVKLLRIVPQWEWYLTTQHNKNCSCAVLVLDYSQDASFTWLVAAMWHQAVVDKSKAGLIIFCYSCLCIFMHPLQLRPQWAPLKINWNTLDFSPVAS